MAISTVALSCTYQQYAKLRKIALPQKATLLKFLCISYNNQIIALKLLFLIMYVEGEQLEMLFFADIQCLAAMM